MNLKPYLLRYWNLWPPFLFTGIKVEKTSKDYRHINVRLKLRFWNANFLGTQYGGSMFSLCDPFYMIMLIKNLGPEYSVWDKSAQIRYLKPGRQDVFAEFRLTEADLEEIRQSVSKHGKMEWHRKIEVKDKDGALIAEVDKVISIKKKNSKE